MYKRGKVKAKESNEILKANNTFAKFIKDKQYDFVTRSNGNYVNKEENGSALELEKEFVDDLFVITMEE